jgi:5-methylcytosine-specific restriction endonuclease McrA
MNTPPQPCTTPGCPEYATHRGKCPAHAKAQERRRSRQRDRPHKQVYNRKRWFTTRRRQLQAHPFCEAPGCTRLAQDVHHRKDLSDGGDPWDPANLASYCHSCHSKLSGSWSLR